MKEPLHIIISINNNSNNTFVINEFVSDLYKYDIDQLKYKIIGDDIITTNYLSKNKWY